MADLDSHTEEFWVLTDYIREYPGATRDGKQHKLWIAAKRIRPAVPIPAETLKQSVNIIFAGGNGFPKELYEPLLHEIVLRLALEGIQVKTCYTMDMASQGASGRRNEDLLGDDPSGRDYANDILHVIHHDSVGSKDVPLVAIAHSLGGTAMVHLAALYPRLFSQMVLIEPMIMTRLGHDLMITLFSYATIAKTDIWPSREAAEQFFRTTKPYRSWDPRVREQMLQHGIRVRTGGDGEVELVTSKHQEAVSYARPTNADFSAWELPAIGAALALVPFLKPPVSYVFGGKSMLLTADKRADLMRTTGTGLGGSGGAAAQMVTEAEIKTGGHTIPLDAVDECAEMVASAMMRELSRPADEVGRLAQRSFEPGTSKVSEAWRTGVKKGAEAMRRTRMVGTKL